MTDLTLAKEVAELAGGTDSRFARKIVGFQTDQEMWNWMDKMGAELRAKGYDQQVVTAFVTEYAYLYLERERINQATAKKPLLRTHLPQFTDLMEAVVTAVKECSLTRAQAEQLIEFLTKF